MSETTENREKAIRNIALLLNDFLKLAKKIYYEVKIREGERYITVYIDIEGYLKNETMKELANIIYLYNKEAEISIKYNLVEIQIDFSKSDA